ncbi:MAG: type II secretion system F family protein [Myxococcota bacterium]|jgi:tight adherence protein B|nr:type II secretion system F family protein [Myxococcota bacterium]
MSPLGASLLLLSLICLFTALVMALRSWRTTDPAQSSRRLRLLGSRMADNRVRVPELSILRTSTEGSASPGGLFGLSTVARIRAFLGLLLYRAESNMSPGRLLVVCASLAGLCFGVGIQFFFDFQKALVMSVSGFLAPVLVLYGKGRRRTAEFEEALPEALALLGRSLRGGHALQRSLRIVADETSGPIAREFTLVADELSLGREMSAVLDGLSRRIDIPDLALFTSGILLQREFGGNLAEVVDKLATMIRDRFKFQSKVLAMTSANRNSAVILLFMPFSFVGLMYFANRPFIEPLWTTPEGETLAMVGASLAFFGYALARRFAKVSA